MAELDRRKTVIYVHPNIHPSSATLKMEIAGFYIEFLFDTTRAITNLVFAGTVHRYPHIRWIFSHAGGTIPFITWRLSLADHNPLMQDKIPGGVAAHLKSLYYDTALAFSKPPMQALLEFVEPSHVLYDSDFPYAPEFLVAGEISELKKLDLIDEKTRRMIFRENALALIPRLAGR